MRTETPNVNNTSTPGTTKILHDANEFRSAFSSGDKVGYAAPDCTVEIHPIYGLREPEFPLTQQLDTALEYGRRYRTAVEAKDEDGIAEWADELEVLALHTGFPSIRTLCSGLLGTISGGVN